MVWVQNEVAWQCVLKGIPVPVYAGSKASGQPLTTLRSDADGFLTLDLQPGMSPSS